MRARTAARRVEKQFCVSRVLLVLCCCCVCWVSAFGPLCYGIKKHGAAAAKWQEWHCRRRSCRTAQREGDRRWILPSCSLSACFSWFLFCFCLWVCCFCFVLFVLFGVFL